jgi:hypothetical protein
MRFPRMTTRRWMVAVASSAILIASGRLFVRRQNYLHLVEHYRRQQLTLAAQLAAPNRLKVVREFETLVAKRKRELADAQSWEEKLTDPSEREAWEKHTDVVRSRVAYDELVIESERAGAAKNEALQRFFQALEEKYRGAASHPWQPVPADPPAPQ